MKTRILLSLLIPAALSAFAVELPPPAEQWTRLQVGNITIVGNAGPRALRGVAENLISFRETLKQVQRLAVQSPLPTYVYVFQNESGFAPYRDAVLGKNHKDVVGVFFQRGGANWMLMQARSDTSFDRVIYHELTHYFIRNTLPGVFPWLDEGLAGFYETYQPLGRSDTVTVGKPPYKYLDTLREMGQMPLRQLFVQHPLRDHGSGDLRVAQFYIQSWLLMHYLLIGNPERGAGLGPFLTALDQKQPLEAAFVNAFHIKMEEMDAELSSYLRRDRFNMIQYKVPPAGGTIAGATPMSRDDTLFALGDLLSWVDYAAAAPLLAEAVKVNPNHAAALAALGQYDKAVAAAGNDTRPYVRASLNVVAAMQRRARDGEPVDKDAIEKARGWAQKALALEPENVLANAILGATYALPGEEARKGIAASRHAFELAPSMLDVAADLVLLYARAGQPAQAKEIMDRLLVPSGDEEHIAEARENLALADYLRAQELMGSNAAEARALLDRAASATSNEKLKAKIAAER